MDGGRNEREFLFVPRGLAALALVAVVLGRGLAPALPGSLVGFDGIVNWVLTCGAFASQLFAIAGSVVSLRLTLWLSGHQSLSVALRSWLGLTCLLICAVVFFSAQPRLFAVGPIVLALLGFTSSSVLAWSSRLTLRESNTNVVSALLTLASLTALALTLARSLGFAASAAGDALQFELARAIATLGSLLDLALVVGCGWWLWRHIRLTTKAWTSVVLVCLPASFVGAPDAGPRFLAQRFVDALTSHPDPFVPLFLQWGLELTALVLSGVCLVDRGLPRSARLAMLFALLGRTTADRPLGALLLVLSALCVLYPWVAGPLGADEGALGAPDPLRKATSPRGSEV